MPITCMKNHLDECSALTRIKKIKKHLQISVDIAKESLHSLNVVFLDSRNSSYAMKSLLPSYIMNDYYKWNIATVIQIFEPFISNVIFY